MIEFFKSKIILLHYIEKRVNSMLLFELLMYFKRNKVKLLVIMSLLLLAVIFSKKNVYNLLHLSNLLPGNYMLTLSDYVMGIFNSAQFIMFFIFPVLFSILVSDLINSDYQNGLINFILPRIKKRFYYIANKSIMVFILSVLFTALVIFLAFLVGFLFKMPSNTMDFHYIFDFVASTNTPLFMTYLSMIVTFIFGLTFIGMLTLVVSAYTSSSGLAVAFIILLGFFHNILYVVGSDFIIWLPFTQYILGLHYQFVPFGFSVNYFTMTFSNLYIFIGNVLMILLLGIQLRKSEISHGRGGR